MPKLRTGPVEAIRPLRVARSSAVSARAQAMVQMKSLITTASEVLRAQLMSLFESPATLVSACTVLRPGPAALV